MNTKNLEMNQDQINEILNCKTQDLAMYMLDYKHDKNFTKQANAEWKRRARRFKYGN